MLSRGAEIGARLALAKLGHQYHLDFLEALMRDQDITDHKVARDLSLFTRYVTSPQLLAVLAEPALKGVSYTYIDWDFSPGDTVSHTLLGYLHKNLQRAWNPKVDFRLPGKGRMDIDEPAFGQWLRDNLHRPDIIVHERDVMRADYFGGPDIFLKAQGVSPPRPKWLNGQILPPDPPPPLPPNIRHQGACYFDGDTIRVEKPSRDGLIRLMAYKDTSRLMCAALEWEGVDAVEPYHYGVLSAAALKAEGGRRQVRAVCRECGEEGSDLVVSVWVVMGD